MKHPTMRIKSSFLEAWFGGVILFVTATSSDVNLPLFIRQASTGNIPLSYFISHFLFGVYGLGYISIPLLVIGSLLLFHGLWSIMRVHMVKGY